MKEPIIKVKNFEYLQIRYLIILHANSLEIYTAENLELVQRFWFPKTRLINVYYLSSKKTLLVLSERHFFFYSFTFTRLSTIKSANQPHRNLQKRTAGCAHPETHLRFPGRSTIWIGWQPGPCVWNRLAISDCFLEQDQECQTEVFI